ncbi:MAG: arylesterase [Gemmatimonadaceae bacterium]
MRESSEFVVAACFCTAFLLTGCGDRENTETSASRPYARTGVPVSDTVSAAGNNRSDSPTVLFVGTSLTAGLGLDPEAAYPSLIADRIDSLGLRYRVVNAGVSGETSAGALRRIDWLMRGPVGVFVLETGANDGLRGLPVDSLRANIREILTRVRATHPDARIVLVGMEAPPNMGSRYTEDFRAVYPELASEFGASLVPFLLDGVAGVTRFNQADGIHPNEEGAEIVAEAVWRALFPQLR